MFGRPTNPYDEVVGEFSSPFLPSTAVTLVASDELDRVDLEASADQSAPLQPKRRTRSRPRSTGRSP